MHRAQDRRLAAGQRDDGCLPVVPPMPGAGRRLQTYGAAIGLAFQVVDDILDVTADSSTLGKTAGKDAANDKPTYVSLLGLSARRAYAPPAGTRRLAHWTCSGLAQIPGAACAGRHGGQPGQLSPRELTNVAHNPRFTKLRKK
jgi:farnesyl diphosphate synthase